MYQAHYTEEEFASFSVYIPEAKIIGGRAESLSDWALGRDKREDLIQQYPEPMALEDILSAIPEADVVRKQLALARLAPRMIISLVDGERDALRVFLDRVEADAVKTTKQLSLQRGDATVECSEFDAAYEPPLSGEEETRASTARECQERCARVSDCAHFVYRENDLGKCTLASVDAKSRDMIGSHSGPPECKTA